MDLTRNVMIMPKGCKRLFVIRDYRLGVWNQKGASAKPGISQEILFLEELFNGELLLVDLIQDIAQAIFQKCAHNYVQQFFALFSLICYFHLHPSGSKAANYIILFYLELWMGS